MYCSSIFGKSITTEIVVSVLKEERRRGGGGSTNSRLSPRPAFQTGRKHCSFDILFPFAGKHVTFERSTLFRFAASAEQILQLLPASITLLSPLWISCMHSWLCVCVCATGGERRKTCKNKCLLSSPSSTKRMEKVVCGEGRRIERYENRYVSEYLF